MTTSGWQTVTLGASAANAAMTMGTLRTTDGDGGGWWPPPMRALDRAAHRWGTAAVINGESCSS